MNDRQPVAKAIMGKREISCHGPNRKYQDGVVLLQLEYIEPETLLFTDSAHDSALKQVAELVRVIELLVTSGLDEYTHRKVLNDPAHYLNVALENARKLLPKEPTHE